ncbi:MAG TPA: hypothetical protein VNB23_00850 [Ramlibacter sp.]|nr:hypothetical protein [Ramlibacter sp.]
MPSPKNRIKQTGDTHNPDVGYDLAGDDASEELDGSGTQPETALFDDAASGMAASEGGSEGRLQRAQAAYGGYLSEARAQVEAKPLAALGGAFLLGFVLARLTR